MQISALAARRGIRVRRLELLGTPPARWPEVIAAEIAAARPRMVGIHLRQADTLFVWDYTDHHVPGAPYVTRRRYFPVDDTERLIGVVQQCTEVPVVIGGFGFTTHAPRLLERLRPDFGLLGEPDDFLERFDAVVSGSGLDDIANLVHRTADGYRTNRRVYYPPANHPEYTDEILDEIFHFYGENGVQGTGAVHIPVEVQRGCPHRCYFCTEPTVKGRRHRTRDLDAVMQDVRFLADRGVARVWLVCSEINIGGNVLLFDIAERMVALNRGRESPIGWSSYLLPNPSLEPAQIRALLQAGFEPGWNQFMSYDDDNLRSTRVPYRARHAIAAQRDWAVEELRFEEQRRRAPQHRRLDMFLGNSYATAQTISSTLARADDHQLPERFDGALITRATRVFPTNTGERAAREAVNAFSIGPHGRLDDVDLLYPTFSYPTALVDALGSPQEVDEFFAFVEDTYLSTAHRFRKDWCTFLAHASAPTTFLGWLDDLRASLDSGELPAERAVELARRVLRQTANDRGRSLVTALFRPAVLRHPPDMQLLARSLASLLATAHADRAAAVFALIGLPEFGGRERPSAYAVARVLSARYETEAALWRDVHDRLGVDERSLTGFVLRFHLHDHNVRIRPDYVRLLFPADQGLHHPLSRTTERTALDCPTVSMTDQRGAATKRPSGSTPVAGSSSGTSRIGPP